ncbi:ABC transporter ATP-binding protein [Paenibacillus ehimensis]|uniref:ABC transporter ATP-binding protein n=1 Tax=Paenibacillus ehimensis TaxID=79264 RepID=A0ABT8V5U8_9BACL|nr:ABC transporter ATP-binding protein [Paenibacillus ehimensis]MDO3676810.1 ABC transporter ATP-binding protein [Paenibacillus ehimensis]MEC0210397.1 ABC transporter ATP-binding protein [Paenibacillus ehimensis]
MLKAENLAIRYGDSTIIKSLDLELKQGQVTSIIGPNGCGKSTLLKALARQMPRYEGTVYLDGKDVKQWQAKPFARQLAFLMQSHEQLGDISVKHLVSFGRFPHKNLMKRMNEDDLQIVERALSLTGIKHLEERTVSTLSGGERQRAWIAMALAQQPGILLLDEPTTYLDICHQLEIMELVKLLNRTYGLTIVMVLHDLNHASSYSDQIIMMNKGSIFAYGAPNEVMNEGSIGAVFGVRAKIHPDPDSGVPLIHSMMLM